MVDELTQLVRPRHRRFDLEGELGLLIETLATRVHRAE
jgi:hypothetical protein